MAEAKKTPVEPGIIERLTGSVRGKADAFLDAWFGPGKPNPQTAPPGTEPRAFDYPTGLNTFYAPRGYEPITFGQLRGLAENFNLLRLIIETRKDQLVKLPWDVRLKPKPGETKADATKRSKKDARLEQIRNVLLMPDLLNPWETWLRMYLEELLVIDAPSVLVRRTVDGTPAALELVDGATIHPLVDRAGRTPLPGQKDDAGNPAPAYQQIIKGTVIAQFAADELLYLPRNRRVHKLYGFSPVEQIVFLTNIALRRDISKLDFYTVGNLPLGIQRVPETWTQKQILEFQKAFDAMMEASESRSRLVFVPDTKADPVFPKIDMLKDTFDDFLVRLVCYAFSVSPSNLVVQMNRATADNAHEEAREEGYQPLMTSIKTTMDHVIRMVWKYDDVEFLWQFERNQDTKAQAEIDKIYIDAKVLTPNEVRDELGREPLDTPEANGITPPPVDPFTGKPTSPGGQVTAKPGQPKPAEKPAEAA